MSVESEILRIQHNVADAYAQVAEKGGNVPLQPNSTNLAAAVASIPEGGDSGGGVPTGCILFWSGAANAIPDGWTLCDGTNGTPDLRDKFVLGAGENHPVGESGGSEEVTLTIAQMPNHRHDYYTMINAATKFTITQTGSSSPYYTNMTTQATGGNEPHPNMPPYYALCCIMKL